MRRIIQSFGSQKRIAGGALVLALTQFGASVAGLVRDRVLASTFPPGVDQLDTVAVYIAAFRPSDLLFQMFVMSAFSVALVPLLAGHLAHKNEEEMNKLLTSALGIACVVFGVLALLLALFMEHLAPLLTEFTGARLRLYVHFARMAAFTNFLFVMGNAFGQYLIVRQTYWAYGVTPILYTAGTIVGAVWLTPIFGEFGPIVGTVAGAVAYTAVRAGAAGWKGFVLRPCGVHPELFTMGALMLPRMAALGAMQVQLLLFDKLASGLSLGAITINAYARNFQAAAVGIVGIALAQSAYSVLSQSIAQRKIARFRMILKQGSLLTLGLTIPAAIVLVLLAKVCALIVSLTDPKVLHTFVVALSLYALSIPFESMNHLLLRACYATRHTGVPAVLSVLNGALAIASAWIFAPHYGVYALAGGFAVGQLVQMAGLWGFLYVRVRKM